MGNGVVSKSQSHPTAYMPDKGTLPYLTTFFNTFLIWFSQFFFNLVFAVDLCGKV